MTETAAPASSRLNDLLRAVFLGVSWTWVIGMFLPVLLVRNYGPWAWVIFAVPNVVGAAAMGWVMRTREQSRDLVAAHDAACRAFSIVTVSFHVFVVCWVIVPWMNWKGLVPGAFLFFFAFLTMRSSGVALAAVLTYIYSLICAGLMLGEGGAAIVETRAQPPGVIGAALAALVPVCLLGFALNPYLDLTFHAARQASDDRRGARLAFGAGFGVFFLSMIVFTLLYSGVLWRDLVDSAVSGRPPDSRSVVWFVAGHILFQAAFTAGIHTAVATAPLSRPQAATRRGARTTVPWLGLLIAVAAAVAAATWANRTVYAGEMLAGEFAYRCYMSFYGLIFPAYAWICMAPTWRQPTRPSARALAVFVIAVLLAAPFYAVAFLGQRMPWAVAGVAIVLLARLAVPAGAGAGRRVAVDSA